MTSLIVSAHIRTKPEHVEFVKTEARKLLPTTRKEEGCIRYDLHQDNHNATLLMFYEIWESYELWQRHMNAEHLQAFMAATEGKLESVELYELTAVA